MSDTTTQAPAPQGTHHYVLTLQIPTGGGLSTSTWTGTWTPPEGAATRHDFYRLLRDNIAQNNPQFTDAYVVFFDVQPNQL